MHRKSALAFILALLAPVMASADISSEIHIKQDGTIVANNVLVMQKSEGAGNNLFVRATWGQAFVRMTLTVNSSTKITKEHGESSSAADIKVGDRLDIEGQLTSGADTILFTPTKIVDHSLLVEQKNFSGTIQSLDPANRTFVIKNGNTTTTINTSGILIAKGVRMIPFSELVKGDKVLSAGGQYDYQTNTLMATSLAVYQDPAVFKPRNFDGKLKTINGTTLPTSLTVTAGGRDYTVFLSATSTVLSKSKAPSTLTRALVGDAVRFYGSIRQSNLSEVDAEVLRDLAF